MWRNDGGSIGRQACHVATSHVDTTRCRMPHGNAYASRSPLTSATVSPFIRSATPNPAIWAGVAAPSMISPIAQAVSPEVFLPRFDADGSLEPAGGEWPELGSARLEQMNLAGLLRRALDGMDESTRVAFVLCDLVQLPPGEAVVENWQTLQLGPRLTVGGQTYFCSGLRLLQPRADAGATLYILYPEALWREVKRKLTCVIRLPKGKAEH